jgi:transcriptional regulator with XRE-family HTH domain
MSNSKAIVGRKIKLLRKKKGYTQQELADLLGVDRQYIWKLENGKKNLTMDYLDNVINKLEAKYEDFFIINQHE